MRHGRQETGDRRQETGHRSTDKRSNDPKPEAENGNRAFGTRFAKAVASRKSERFSFRFYEPREDVMNNLLRGGLAGAAAYKFGGGIITTILIFVLIFWLLGKF